MRLQTPAGPLDVFNTHLHANYSHKFKMTSSRSTSDMTAAATASLKSPRGSNGAAAVATEEEFKIPRDSQAAFRVAQMCEIAQVSVMCEVSSV